MKECVICNAEFEPIRDNHVYCSTKCYSRKDNKDWTKTCEVCGATYKNKAHNSKTCNKICTKIRAKAIRPKQPSKIQPAIKRTCVCGKEFEAVGQGRKRLSCSKECSDKRRRKQIREHDLKRRTLMVRTCEFCPTTFNPQAGQRTCLSDECQKKLKKTYYNKYYKTPDAEKRRIYRNKNKIKINAWFREYNAKRRQDPKHRISGRMYDAIRHAVRNFEVSTTKTIQGLYTNEELFNHLESQFTEENGYSWDNMSEWHIDHIRPIASFNYDSTEHPDFKKCWALNNLQPLWAVDNIRKSDKWDGKVNA